jgi:hypothetical protein
MLGAVLINFKIYEWLRFNAELYATFAILKTTRGGILTL